MINRHLRPWLYHPCETGCRVVPRAGLHASEKMNVPLSYLKSNHDFSSIQIVAITDLCLESCWFESRYGDLLVSLRHSVDFLYFSKEQRLDWLTKIGQVCLILLVTSSLVIRAYLLFETEKCKSEGFVAEACIVCSVLGGSSQSRTFRHHGVLCTAHGRASEQTEVLDAKTA